MSRGYGTYTSANGSGAVYKAYYQTISTAIAAALGSRTADTGQVDWAAVSTEPIGTVRDYEIFPLGGAIQGSAPLFIRVDYKGGTAANTHGVFISTGTGTDGAGNLTGVTTPATVPASYGGINVGTRAVYASSDRDSYFTLMYDTEVAGSSNTGTLATVAAVVERTRTLAGDANGDGWVVHSWRYSSLTATMYNGGWSRTFAGPSQPAAQEFTIPYLLPNPTTLNTAFVSDTAYAFPTYPYAGNKVGGASKAFLLGLAVDFPRMSEISISHYGTQMAFLAWADIYSHNMPYMTAATSAAQKPMMPILRWE